ncbi:DUF4817 domain-containing protein [Trichonephila clavipes]|nr:DUF4817 domain-containing protein [Trichonephila clavipes]
MLPQSTLWTVLRKKLHFKPYKLKTVQALNHSDELQHLNYCLYMDEAMQNHFFNHHLFSDEATFHLSGKVNRHIEQIWGTENPHACVEHLKEMANFIFQQDSALSHWQSEVCKFLNRELPHCWISRSAANDLIPHSYPPWSPDSTPCIFFLWGYVKDLVFVPLLHATLPELL